MGRSRRETDAPDQDHTDSRAEGEEYTTVDKNYVVSVGFIITIACLAVPLLWGVFKYNARLDQLEHAIESHSRQVAGKLAGQGAYGWDREQAIRQWEGYADLNPSNIVPDPRDIGYHDPASGRWIRPPHSPAVHP